MFDRNGFEGFDFNRRRNPLPRLLVIEAIGLGLLLLLWWLVPPALLFCLLMPSVAALIWVASFGWRQALARLIEFLQSFEDHTFGGVR